MMFALHMPDHTLTAELSWAAAAAVAIVAVIGLVRRREKSARPSIALFAAVTALLFAVQMVNFPLLDGRTSGHILGAAAAVLLLGPAFGVLAMALVLVVQAIAMGDGGVAALGANILNMAILAPAAAMITANFVRQRRSDAMGTIVAAALAGWVGTVVAALACAAELAASGVGSFASLATALVGHHAMLGFVEAAFTVAVVVPTLLPAANGRRVQIASLAVAAAVVFALTPVSSELPDTLEVVLPEQR